MANDINTEATTETTGSGTATEVKKYDKARIKLLDKNTGQVLKEVDPFTSADAVDYKDSKTVYDALEELMAFQELTNQNIGDLQDKDTYILEQIDLINDLNKNQQDAITELQELTTIHSEQIQNLFEITTEHSESITSINNRLDNHDTLITEITTKLDSTYDLAVDNSKKISVLETKVTNLETNVTNITNQITTMTNGSPSKVFVSSSDPGSLSKTNDVWADTSKNVIKYKQANGTWKILGAAYN